VEAGVYLEAGRAFWIELHGTIDVLERLIERHSPFLALERGEVLGEEGDATRWYAAIPLRIAFAGAPRNVTAMAGASSRRWSSRASAVRRRSSRQNAPPLS
jgi:hypothetical protein